MDLFVLRAGPGDRLGAAQAGRIAAPWKQRLGKVHLGILGYAIGGIAAGFGQQGRHLEVVADDEVIADGSRRVLQVAATIGTSVGGGSMIAPDAAPGDGRAEVVVSFAVAPRRRLRYALRLSRGTHTELYDVVTRRARTVTVRGDRLAVTPIELDSVRAKKIRAEIPEALYESGKSQLSVRVPKDPAQRFPAIVRTADVLLSVTREAEAEAAVA